MAKFIVCDVCGHKMSAGFWSDHRRACRVDLDYGCVLDLCPECCRDLQTWLSDRKNEKMKEMLGLTADTKG